MPVHARDAVVNDNEPGSVQKSAPRESQIGVHIQLRWFAVENLLPARNVESSPAHAPYFSRATVRTALARERLPPNTRTISNTNSKKCMIALRCLLDESDQCVRSAAEYPGNECSQ